MQLLNIDQFRQLLRNSHRSFHLETQDGYAVDDEADALATFIETGAIEEDPSWSAWDDMVKEITSSGRLIQRVRVVTEPHTDYTRFLHATTQANVDVGEDIRWLPRHAIDPGELTADDWWSLDEDTIAFTAFEPDGNLGGLAVTTDPVIVRYCLAVRDTVWDRAIPHADYPSA